MSLDGGTVVMRLVGLLLALVSLGLGTVAALGRPIGLTPCGSLDRTLDVSGCLTTFDAYLVEFSPDGALAVAAGWQHPAIELRRVADGDVVRTIETDGTSYALAFSPDGALLARGWYQTAALWRVADGTPVADLPGHAKWVQTIAFSPDGAQLATASADDPAIRLWRAADGTPAQMLDGHHLGANSLTFSPDGSTLAAILGDGSLAVWDATTWQPRYRLVEETFAARDLAFSPDGQLLAVASSRIEVRLLRASDGEVLHVLQGEAVAFSPDGAILATANGQLRLWRTADGTEIRRLSGHDFEVEDVAFSPDGQRLVSAGGQERTVRVWRVADGAALRMIEVPGEPVTGVGVLADGETISSTQRASTSNPVRLWGPETRIAKLPTWLGVAASVGLGLAILVLGLPRTPRSEWPWRWAGGILLLGGSFMVWGPLWLLEGDATTYVVIFFGALFTFGAGLRQVSRSFNPRLSRWRMALGVRRR